MLATAQQGDTLDLICWRELGSVAPIEDVLDRNPGLADAAVLEPGTLVDLPDALPATVPDAGVVQLWD